MNYNELSKTNGAMINYEGGEAFALPAEMELYTAVVTSVMEPTYYEWLSDRVERLCRLVKVCDDMFVAQLAVYARRVMNLRSVPMLLVVELARKHNGDDLVARTVAKVVMRADEIMELLTCYAQMNPSDGRKKLGRLSCQIRKGLQYAFNQFDEYQFAKYNNTQREVTLRDALFLVHPKAKDEAQQAIFDKIATGTLATPYTWEVELSTLGQQPFESPDAKAAAFSAKWQELIASRRLGYMALLRNLRNILMCKDMPIESIAAVSDYLTDAKAIAHSRQMPFRYLSAYRTISGVQSKWKGDIMDALERAARVSASNIVGFDEDTRVVIAADVSGSMNYPISRQSDVRRTDIGLMLGMMFKTRCRRAMLGVFGDRWKVVDIPSDDIFKNVAKMSQLGREVGYSTNGYKAIEYLLDERIKSDKVLIFTDCQMWNSFGDGATFRELWHQYKGFVPGARLYIFDLAGYGQTPISVAEPDVYLIAGWNERVFDVLYDVEHSADTLDRIKSLNLSE